MSNKTEKPYVLRAAEFVYENIVEIKKQNTEINNIQAFEIFMTTKEYDILSSGEFHDKWFLKLKNNKFVDNVTKKKNRWRNFKTFRTPKRLNVKIFNENS